MDVVILVREFPRLIVREPHMLVLMMLGLTVIVWMHRRQANVTLH